MGATVSCGSASTRQNFPHDPVAALPIFEFAACRHKVSGALVQAVAWKISASGIAEQDEAATGGQNPQPRGDPPRHPPLVADIAGGADLPDRVGAGRALHLCHPWTG